MSKAELHKAVADTARVVEEWASNIKKIEAQLANANSRLEKSEADRKTLALNAAMRDAQAIAELAKARAEHTSAQGDLHDLGHALNDAKLRLIEAEGEAKKARQALAKFEVDILKRQRIDVAGQLDKVIVELARLHDVYAKLGAEITNMPDALPPNMHGITNHEAALGARRVRASLPKFFWRLFPGAVHDEMKTENLATSEARFWNLAPEQPEKAKAA